jgi:uridine kinase
MADDTIQVEFSGQMITLTPGTTVHQWLEASTPDELRGPNPVVIASINGRRTHLAELLHADDRVRLIRLQDREAQTTIQRTVQFLAAMAADDVFPGQALQVDFSYAGGMYCEVDRPEPLTDSEVETIAGRMATLVAADQPLVPQRFGLRALLKKYQRAGDERNVRTAKYLRRESLEFFRTAGSELMYYGRQLPSTGFVKAFKLIPQSPGFVLMSNVKGHPAQVPEYLPQTKLLDTMREYSQWVERVGLEDTGALNEHIVNGRTSDVIQISEARHNLFFVEAAEYVSALPESGRLILLAGPSSSGKTSSAKRLSVQLRVLGYRPFALSLDNYFVDREATPLAEDGDYDYEALSALNVDLFNEHLQALMAGEEVHLPRYDFVTGKGELAAEPTRIEHGQPLLVEGIHALNPQLTPRIPDAEKMRVYVSALCHLNINNFSYIKTTDSRLYRRIVRDAKFRGYTASETLARWPKVRAGEEKHIFPFQNNADLFFNSGLTYELAVLKLWAEPRLAAVDADDPHYGLARTLIDQLSLLLPVDASQVPPTSLLREFIGGSGFNY